MIRVFPYRNSYTPNDDLSFCGFPPMFRPPEQPVHISVTFTWDIPYAEHLRQAWADYYPDVQIGGPAFGDGGGEFVPGRYTKQGITITSRGCSKTCSWCFVPRREGKIRELPIQPGHIVQDNNLLACSESHIRAVFEMLKTQTGVRFLGGIDTTLLQGWHRPLFDSINLKEIWVACDTVGALKPLTRAAKILDGMPIDKLHCYVMVGKDGETIEQAQTRLGAVLDLGFMPFAQLYRTEQDERYNPEWKEFVRQWTRPAFYMRNRRKSA